MFSRADAYERFMGRWSRSLASMLVAYAEVHDGDVVLDVGSGTGSLARALCDVGPSVRVSGVDASADYVRYAAHELADARVQFELGDAQQLRFAAASFDKTLSALVLNFVPEPARALSEMSRVTKPAGVVAAAVWDYPEGMQMLRLFWDEAVALDPASAPRDEAHMPLSKQDELAALFRQQGLEDVRASPLTAALHFASFDDYWSPFLLGQGPAGNYLAGLSEPHRIQLERRLRERLLGAGPDGTIELQARAWAVKGTVP
jgi:SAM-dependent methyltransferase